MWQYEYLGDLRAVDVAVGACGKIERDSAKPEHIMTKRGIGYYYEPYYKGGRLIKPPAYIRHILVGAVLMNKSLRWKFVFVMCFLYLF